ncbi:MAG TPA: hypothetical protein VFQ51_15905, partial [Vicinamibacteria bacterium]|nr:hypothetical protein [Vicinamibacteria bacterium]
KGDRGEPGPKGDQGPQGPSGVAQLRVVTAPGNASDHSALVNCPDGFYAIGGGGQSSSNSLKDSAPSLDNNNKPVGWKVTAMSGTPTAFAICAPSA